MNVSYTNATHENSNEQPQLNFRDTTRTTETAQLTGCYPRSKLVTGVRGGQA